MLNRHLFCLLLAFLCCSATAFAQKDSTDFRPSFAFGVQYGMNWSDVRFSPVVQQNILQANRFALLMRYVSDPHLGIQVEAAYDQRGWEEKRDNLSSNYSRQVDYLDLSFLTYISIGKASVRPLILLGSFMSYPISQKETYPSEWSSNPLFHYGEDLPDRFQFGLKGGLGVEFFLKRFSIQLDGRYRSTLNGFFASKDSPFTFSNSKGFMAQASILWAL